MVKLRCIICSILVLVFAEGLLAIYNGSNAYDHDNPFQAAILFSNVTIKKLVWKKYICTGYVISSRWIVTAAHCCARCSQLQDCSVLLGTSDLSAHFSRHAKHMKFQRAEQHPAYQSGNTTYDICLLQTRKVIKFNNDVAPICFANPGLQIKNGTNCTMAGWGSIICHRDFPFENEYPEEEKPLVRPPNSTREAFLFYIKAPVYRLQTLSDVQKESSEYCTSRALDPGVACARSLPNEGPYTGDSGGPLKCTASDEYEYAFATFKRNVCMVENYPAEYTDNQLPDIFEWVQTMVGEHELNRICRNATEDFPVAEFLSEEDESIRSVTVSADVDKNV
ncbi:serine protease 27-like isoform X2 [Paramacrobiotus metropolitanus]|uniref:serine protease 27-like isoform X2 n=1 Tax=Paramacrobiotus metropolitanus TaxID=2943436 RepID=UPI0024459DD5|nr:serine protease 27-like isoform X2 [Paramacrobiotus metropolitanus]